MAVVTITGSDVAGGVPSGGPVGGASSLTTVGAVPYVSATGVLSQDQTVFFWDATNNRLGIGTATPGYPLHVAGEVFAEVLTVTGGNAYGLITSGSNGLIRNASSGNRLITLFNSSDNVSVGNGTTDGNYKLDVNNSGSAGTLRVFDQTATTGATLVTISRGAGQTNTSNVLAIDGTLKFGGANSTGAGAALLGSNSPASTLTAPYTWIRAVSSDGSTVYIPCWK